jgi:hypothetical protein
MAADLLRYQWICRRLAELGADQASPVLQSFLIREGRLHAIVWRQGAWRARVELGSPMVQFHHGDVAVAQEIFQAHQNLAGELTAADEPASRAA